tara:strand:+ start:4849 stop:6447 length:1599 start_codon:yes stop_codon:yes gene_type:complete
MSKLTFGIELEMFIKLNKSLYLLINEEIKKHGFTKIEELINYIYKKLKKMNPYIVHKSNFIQNVNNIKFNNTELSEDDSYIIMLIIAFIICNNKHYFSVSLNDILMQNYSYIIKKLNLPNCNKFSKSNKLKINWHYDPDTSIQYSYLNKSINTYKTIKQKNKEKLTLENHVPYTEFVSSIFNNPEEVKNGMDLLMSSLQKKLKLSCFHSIQTSNHIHFSIKQNKLDDPYIIFQITYVFYILQNFIYLICLPDRRNSKYCNPLKILPSNLKNLDDKTINEFFSSNIILPNNKSYQNIKHYFNIQENIRIQSLIQSYSNEKTSLLQQSNTTRQFIKKINNIQKEIDKLTKIDPIKYNSEKFSNTYRITVPFNKLLFNDKLIVLLNLFQNQTQYKYDNFFKVNAYQLWEGSKIDRYSILNLYKLSLNESCTLELRAKHGSNDSTEIKYFCSLIEKFYEIALQLDKNKPLLESLSEILDIPKEDLISFKNIDPKDLKTQYSTLKTTFLPKLLYSIFKDDSKSINYWLKHLDIIQNF